MENVESLGRHRFLVKPRPIFGTDEDDGTGQTPASWNGRTWWYHFSITVPEEHLPYWIELELDASRVWFNRMYSHDNSLEPPFCLVPEASCAQGSWEGAHDQTEEWKSLGVALAEAICDVEGM